MKRSEAVAELLKRGEVVKWGNKYDDGVYNKLVEQGLCELEGAFFRPTEATHLAILSPACLKRAERLAAGRQKLCLIA